MNNKSLFNRSYIYPRDEIGSYMELTGTIINLDNVSDGFALVDVDRCGRFTVYSDLLERYPNTCNIGYTAIVRIYDAGGGFYPQNQLMNWKCQ